MGAEAVPDVGGIEAKPRSAREPRLRDALDTIDPFLAGRPTVQVYRWPPPVRMRYDDDYEDDDYDEE